MVLDVPFFAQERFWTCGPASLRMVLASLGASHDESQVAACCGTDLGGSTCDELADGAQALGFEAGVTENLSFRELRAALEGGLPIIALLDAGVLYHDIAGFAHLVVVIGLEQRQVVFHGPERGAYQRASYSEFWRAWGECDYLGVKICHHTRR